MTTPNTIPINPNRIGGSIGTYPDDPGPFQRRNITPQPSTNRAQQFVPPPVVPGGGGGGGGG
jgi:hypothetical protein